MKRLWSLAKKVIETKSISADGNEELCHLYSGMMTDANIKATQQQITHSLEGYSKRQYNVLGVMGDPLVDRKIFRGLLLTSPIETSRGGNPKDWTQTDKNPFAATIKDEKIYGPGTVSGKLDFLCKVLAAEKFRERKLKMPIYLAGTCMDEAGFLGSRYLLKSLAFNPKYVLTGSPTQLKLGVGQKSAYSFRVSLNFHQIERDSKGFNRRIELTARGRAVHTSHPDQGINAITKMLRFLNSMQENKFEMRFTDFFAGESHYQVPDEARTVFYLKSSQFEDFKDFCQRTVNVDELQMEFGGVGDSGVKFIPEHVFNCLTDLTSFFGGLEKDLKSPADLNFAPPYSTLSFVRLLQSEGALECHFDVHALPSLDYSQFQNSVKTGVSSVATRFPEYNLSLLWDKPIQALQKQTGEKAQDKENFLRICEDALATIPLETAPYFGATLSDVALFAEKDYPVITFGPGAPELKQAPNEAVTFEELERAIVFYSRVIERTCL